MVRNPLVALELIGLPSRSAYLREALSRCESVLTDFFAPLVSFDRQQS